MEIWGWTLGKEGTSLRYKGIQSILVQLLPDDSEEKMSFTTFPLFNIVTSVLSNEVEGMDRKLGRVGTLFFFLLNTRYLWISFSTPPLVAEIFLEVSQMLPAKSAEGLDTCFKRKSKNLKKLNSIPDTTFVVA